MKDVFQAYLKSIGDYKVLPPEEQKNYVRERKKEI